MYDNKITLVSRAVKCSNMTEEEFVNLMFSDLLEAEEKYNDLYAPEFVANTLSRYFDSLETTKRGATKVAEKRWKTEKKRNAYVLAEIAKLNEQFSKFSFYDKLSFFDFKVDPGSMGISSNCIISYNELTFKNLAKCFNEIKNNEYFKKATGWKLTYTSYNKDSYRVCFRPQINLILDEETEKKMKKEAADLAAEVMNFYANTSYPGD